MTLLAQVGGSVDFAWLLFATRSRRYKSARRCCSLSVLRAVNSHRTRLVDGDATPQVSSRFAAVWARERLGHSHSPSLLRAFFGSFGREYMWLGLVKFLCGALVFSGPVVLNLLVTFVDGDDEPAHNGCCFLRRLVIYDCTESLTRETAGIFMQRCWWRARCCLRCWARCTASASISSPTRWCFNCLRQRSDRWLQLRAAIVSRVYEKSLTISHAAKRNFSSGQITVQLSCCASVLNLLCLLEHHGSRHTTYHEHLRQLP